jgi:KH domain
MIHTLISLSVGLVVGPKGATIKHIQQQTQTYIVTPSRDKEPVFEGNCRNTFTLCKRDFKYRNIYHL